MLDNNKFSKFKNMILDYVKEGEIIRKKFLDIKLHLIIKVFY